MALRPRKPQIPSDPILGDAGLAPFVQDIVEPMEIAKPSRSPRSAQTRTPHGRPTMCFRVGRRGSVPAVSETVPLAVDRR
jgi:hypothetical protein